MFFLLPHFTADLCSREQVRCPEGICIPRTWWCDGQEDCIGNGDEAYCGKLSPFLNYFFFFLIQHLQKIC